MAKIYELKIKNFRGIKSFEQIFKRSFYCFVGRGDSGKSTVLDAISYVLSPQWNLTFLDSDFFDCDVEKNIEIEASLIDLPEEIIKQYKSGMHLRGLDKSTGQIIDDLEANSDKDLEDLLTIRLTVARDLEPKWEVINNRPFEPKRIGGTDRARLNVFMISEYLNEHFSWNKGRPLYSLLKSKQNDSGDSKQILVDAFRQAKEQVDGHSFEELEEVTEEIKEFVEDMGVNMTSPKTTIDFKDLSIKGGRVCLHDDKVPFRLKGKGSKRLISIAIQRALLKKGSITLIDDVEQGLEPDRVRHLVRRLRNDNDGQIFLTTHSSEVITELEVEDLLILKINAGDVDGITADQNYQDIIRACPEAGFSKKVIVCEGKTEIGICRALDVVRNQKQGKLHMSGLDCVYVLGEGDSFVSRAKKLKELGLNVCVYCDSDLDTSGNLKSKKDDLEAVEIKVFDCDRGNNIEMQAFKDLPWDCISELVQYRIGIKGEASVRESIKSKYGEGFPDDFLATDSEQMRKALSEASTVEGNEWFKQIKHGEVLGGKIFQSFENNENKILYKRLQELSGWIDD